MKVIDPTVVVSLQSEPQFIMQTIEEAGRTCYKSEDRINENSYVAFIERLVRRGHEAMLEHGYATAHFRIDRGVSHELVRHRLASYAQESTRYCNYKDKDIEFVRPSYLNESSYELWTNAMLTAEEAYNQMIKNGCTPQQARAVLPNSLATTIVVTVNGELSLNLGVQKMHIQTCDILCFACCLICTNSFLLCLKIFINCIRKK